MRIKSKGKILLGSFILSLLNLSFSDPTPSSSSTSGGNSDQPQEKFKVYKPTFGGYNTLVIGEYSTIEEAARAASQAVYSRCESISDRGLSQSMPEIIHTGTYIMPEDIASFASLSRYRPRYEFPNGRTSRNMRLLKVLSSRVMTQDSDGREIESLQHCKRLQSRIEHYSTKPFFM